MKVLKDLAVSGQITVGQLLQSSIDTDKFIVSDGGVAKFRTGSQLLGDIDGVINTRTITINGTAQDLTANRSWTVGDVRTDSSYANPAWITSLAWSKITGAPAFLTAEADTLATVTGRGNTTTNRIGVLTSSPINLATAGNSGTWIGGIQDGTTGWSISNNGIGFKADDTTYAGIVLGSSNGILYFGRTQAGGVGTMTNWLQVNSSLTATFSGNISAANLSGTNTGDQTLSGLGGVPTSRTLTINGTSFDLSTNRSWTISVTEADTLATVTSRGSTTSTALTLSGRVTFGSAIADRPQMPGGILGIDTGDGNFDIWGISRDYYPSHATAANAWGILWNGDNNQIRFIGAGSQRLVIDLDGGSTGALTWEGNNIWHAGNLTNLNQLTNGPGYITSYTETDTLASVTGRGSSTNTAVSFTGGSRIVVQASQDGGNSRGIFMWNGGDSNWGIYMAQAGAGKALSDGTAPAGIDGRTEHAIRFRVAASTTQIGFLWENSDNNSLMQLQPNTGNLYTRGQIYAGNSTSNLVWHSGNLTNLNQLSNGPGYITSSGSITGSAGSVAWTNVTGRPSALSSFTNDIVARTTLNASGDFQYGGQDLANNNFSLSGATTDTDQFGRYYYSGSSGSFWSRYLPVDKSGKYRMKIRWKASSGSGTYIAVILLDTNGNNINGAGTYWAYPWSGSAAPTSWTTNEYWYDGSSFPANAAYVAFGISHTNYGGGSATYYVSQLEIEKYNFQINGNAILHAGNFSSYAPSISGGSTIGGITYFSNVESINLYGIRGRFTNEYIHLYNKVGIGHPSGWGQGEGNTPNQGLSTYGGINVAYGTNASSTFNGNLLTAAGLSDTSYVRINNPGGGSYVTTTATITGAIRIKLPTQGSAMMMTCTVKVYEYSTNRSFTITFGGHRDSNNWYNEFCYLDGGDSRGELTVRFGVDGGKDCVYIGETNTSWSYPQVFVTDVQLGYTGYSATWLSGWEIAFVTGFSTVNRTQTAYRKLTPANYNSYAPTLTGGGASGTWSINITGNANSASTVTHLASRTDNAWYNTVWASGSPSYLYSSDSVRILSSQGAIRANLYYDNEDTAYYLDPNNPSLLKYVEGSNDASFRGANRAINDWDYSGLTTNPTVNGYDDGSWYIDCGASNDWSRGLLSKRRFRRVENLTLEYEAYLEASTGGCIHYMIGFVGGDSTSYNYCQTPSNLNYHDCSNIAVYTNCSGSGSDYDFDSRNAWWRFKIVLKGSGARHYVYRGDEWRLIKDTSANNQNDYEWVRVLVSGYRQRIYLRDVKVYVADSHRRGSEYISSIAGRLRVATDVRTPILIDSLNESYWCDPDGYSSLWGVAIRGDYSAGGGGNQLFLWGAGGTTTSGIGFKQVGGVWADHGATSGGYNTYFTMDTNNRGWVFRRATVGGSDWTGVNVASISNFGHAQFDGSVKSPIFIDSVNQSYYLDAASGSRLHRVTLDQSRVDSSRYPIGHYTPSETVFEIDPTWSEDQLQAYFNSSSVYWTNDSTAPGGYAIRIDGSVNVGGTYSSGFPYIPVDQDDVFYMECWIRAWDGASGHYMGSIDFNHNFSSLGGNPGSFGYWTMSNTYVGTGWQKVSGYISGFGSSTGQFVSGTKYWTPQALFNYSHYSGTHRCIISGWKVIKVSQPGNRTFRNNITANGAVYASNWFRTYGNSGWYSETYGGGMFMEDTTWVRVYGGKQFYVSNSSAYSIASVGDIVAYYSDERLKQKIGKIENALDKVTSLNAFYYINNNLANSFGYSKSDLQIGLSAQEVQKIAPEIVSLAPFDMKTLESGDVVSKSGENYLTVKYDRLVPILVEAIKEQQKQIEELKSKLDAVTK